jgi:hypothetical protein
MKFLQGMASYRIAQQNSGDRGDASRFSKRRLCTSRTFKLVRKQLLAEVREWLPALLPADSSAGIVFRSQLD